MPSFGLGEILLILVVIVLFIRPEDLPRFIRNFGRVYGDAQRFFIRMRSFSKETLNELAQADSTLTEKKRIPAAPSSTPKTDPDLNVCERAAHTSESVANDKQDSQNSLLVEQETAPLDNEDLRNCEENLKLQDDSKTQRKS